ncbi:hypothetical protein VNO77_39404 [Canavalia gladiata]|uniref:Uncharacterized protein n=1 Tax=Canavalia gladiata TaxID=3824 RepID=A0AAN9KCJ8_CANGL
MIRDTTLKWLDGVSKLKGTPRYCKTECEKMVSSDVALRDCLQAAGCGFPVTFLGKQFCIQISRMDSI